MKFGLRTPSLKKRISARTSVKRYIRHNVGVKAPKGAGIITNPKKYTYNKIYNKTSFSIDDMGKKKSTSKVFWIFFIIIIILIILLFII